MHSAQLTGNVIAYSTALLIAVLLLVLTLRAARLPGTPGGNILFAICAVLWTGGGLAQTAMPAARLGTFVPRAIQFTAAIAVLVPVLAAWQSRVLTRIAAVCGALLAVVVWSGRTPFWTLRPIIAWYAAAILAAAFLTSPARRAARVVFLPSLTIVLAAVATVVRVSVEVGPAWFFLLTHLILVAGLCGFLLFVRFRYADVFVRYSVRILLAGTLIASLISTIQSQFIGTLVEKAPSPAAFHVLATVVVANMFLLVLTFLDEAISRRLIRWLFRAPDYSGEVAALGGRLGKLQDESEIAAALEETARRSLHLSLARVEPAGGAPPRADEVIAPISAGQVLRVSPGPTRPGLVSNDLLYLRDLAAQCGSRLDALRREREAAERQSREATLLQQVTEAELRALRAQINPHFLFNSLNTIADLTVRDPARAETMTVRLAGVFRHVLAHSARPLTTVRDELEFLRTYLYIEEVRFGDRLQVHIESTADVDNAHIPSLILQPLVENALKHALGPKVGIGHLWIRAGVDGADVRLTVEDDGAGLRAAREAKGVGLANIADRLRTLYGDRASVAVESRKDGGCRATVRIARAAV